MSSLNVTQEKQADAAVLKLAGRLDTNTSPAFNDQLLEVLDKEKTVVLDLTDLDYISSAGLRVLLAGQKKAGAQEGAMTLRGVQPAVMDVLDMTGFLEFLSVES